MPLYGDTSLYSTSSSIPSYALYLNSPYSGHSSLISSYSVARPSYIKPSLGRYHRNYAPHLATISENQTTLTSLRKKYSPQLRLAKITVPRPIKINTADIDVSASKYRSADLKEENNEELKRDNTIRRDRATVRIHTVHKDKKGKKWRENFNSFELNTDNKRKDEISKDETKSNDEINEEEEVNEAKGQDQINEYVSKSPSFHDICRAISTDSINEELNPGQPLDVVRKQSRTFSNDDLLKLLNRRASISNKEDLNNNLEVDEFETKGVKKKTKRQSTKSETTDKNLKSDVSNVNSEITSEANLQSDIYDKRQSDKRQSEKRQSEKRQTGKHQSEKSNRNSKRLTNILPEKTPKKVVFTATVDVEEPKKTNLKLIIDDVKVEEKIDKKPKEQKKKFKLDVTVKVEETKPKVNIRDKGKMYIPNSKKPLTVDYKGNKQRGSLGDVCEGIENIEKIKTGDEANVDLKKDNDLKQDLKKDNKIDSKRVADLKTEKVEIKKENTDILKKDVKIDSKRDQELKKDVLKNVVKKDNEIKKDKDVKIESMVDQNVSKHQTKSVDNASVKKDDHNILKKDIQRDLKDVKLDLKNKDVKKDTKEDVKDTIDNIKKDVKINSKDVKLESKDVKIDSKNLKVDSKDVKVDSKDLKVDKAAKINSKDVKVDLKNSKKDVQGDLKKDTTQNLENQAKSDTTIPKWKQDLKKNKEIKPIIKKSGSETDLGEKVSYKKSVSIEEKNNESNENEEDFWGLLGSRSSVYVPKAVELKRGSIKINRGVRDRSIKNVDQNEVEGETAKSTPVSDESTEISGSNAEVPTSEAPTSEAPEEEEVTIKKPSNRLSNWMHPFKKPEQYDECPIEIYATPKNIRRRHFPKVKNAVQKQDEESESSEESSDDDDVGKSTSSNDSGFNSSHGTKSKGNKAPSDTRDSPTSNPSHNPAFALDSFDGCDDFQTTSSTLAGFQKSGRITPPATTIPRFRKYTLDDFNFLKVLGKGSFGKVLLAELKGTEYYYAIKCLKKDVVLEDDDVECTLIERKVLALGTKHPYLCHLLCTFQTESHLFFVMEYLNGGDLMFHIQQTGRFPEARARFYGAEIVSGLKFLHNKGIVYRDLKLDNVLLDFDGHVRIADFGMCKLQIFLDRMADTFCGTPDYMAPEIIKGQHYNQCVDWWSFGVLLYEMLIGQSPFSGCDEDELFWSICNEKPVFPRFLSAEANSVLSQLLEKDWNKRLGNKLSPHGDIQDHAFFRPISWDLLELRHLDAPFKPNLQHPLDTQYFDKNFTVEKAKLTPIEKNILQSMDQTQFQGFSYTNPNATDR